MSQTVDQVITGQSHRLELEGGSIHYFRAGEGAATVFLNSAGDGGQWLPLHQNLSAGRDLIVPDHPGFGNSDDFDSLRTIDDLVYHYLDVFRHLELEKVDLIGSSFGGWIAAELAVHSPELVRSLTLLAPVGLRVPESPLADLFIMSPQQLISSLYHNPELVKAILSVEPTIDDILKNYREMGTLSRFGWSPAFLCNPRLEKRLHRISAPTRVIAAREDKIVPLAHCERYAERISKAELIVLEEIGHALYHEHPEAVSQAIIEFLDK